MSLTLTTVTKVVSNQAAVLNAIDQKIDGAYLYIAGAIRRNARRSIKKGSKSRPHSMPGEAAHSRGKQVLRNTIERDYDKRTKILIVGPKKTGFSPGAQVPVGQTVPQLLEYGGKINASEPTYIHVSRADKRAVNIAFRKQKQAARKKGRRLLKSEVKWVEIPAGVRTVDARPTMRLAFNKTATAQNLKFAFDRIGISDTSTVLRTI